jgi:DNA-binding GntR family transcriptional regulator
MYVANVSVVFWGKTALTGSNSAGGVSKSDTAFGRLRWGYTTCCIFVDVEPMDISHLATSVLQQQRSTSSLVADGIRLAILRGQLVPGQILKQEELAKQFGLSRAPVREALRQLEAEGLVVSYPHRGTAVSKLSPEDIEEVFLIRITLETTLLRLAVPKMTDLDFRKADAVIAQTDNDPNTAHSAELNWAFHESLYIPAGLPRLLSIVRTLNNHALRYHMVFFVALDFKRKSQDGHREILEACRKQDKEAAVAALHLHLTESSKSIVAYVREAISGPTAATSAQLRK